MARKKIEFLPVLIGIGGGVAGELGMDQLNSKVPAFQKNENLAPIAVLAAGVLGATFLKGANMKSFGVGMAIVGGVELARKYTGIIQAALDDGFMNGARAQEDETLRGDEGLEGSRVDSQEPVNVW